MLVCCWSVQQQNLLETGASLGWRLNGGLVGTGTAGIMACSPSREANRADAIKLERLFVFPSAAEVRSPSEADLGRMGLFLPQPKSASEMRP